MKQAWYFTCWLFAKFGWPEVLGAVFMFSIIPTLFISDPKLKEIFQYISLSTLLLVFCVMLYGSIRYMWRQYKEEQAKMFDVLSKEEK